MKIKMIAFAMFGAAVFLGSGCANHIREINTVTQENERNILNTKYELRLSPEIIKESAYHIEITKMESAEVKKYEVRTDKIIETPYQWWREFYEIPASFVLLPASIGTHVMFVATVGMLPYRVADSVTSLAFTGLNPALNWESDTRREERLLSVNRKMLSHTTENVTTPFTKQNIIVRSGDQTRLFATDDFGGFDLNFLALQENDSFFPTARKISFSLASNEKIELKRIILTRDYLSKLLWARTKLNAYKMNPSGKNLFETVIFLEKNGFEQLAYMLEESELIRMAENKKFQAEFKAAASQK